jgi:protein-L-isoaspartate O-methyltransferase
MRWVVMLSLVVLASGGCRRAEDQATRAAAEHDRYRQPQRVVAGLALAPGMRVADVGAGSGYLTGLLADGVGGSGHVVATDIDAQALAAIAHRPTVETRVTQPNEPGLEAGMYNRILLSEVDQYVPDRVYFLRRLATALAPGGFIAVVNRLPYRAPLVAAAALAGLRVTEIPLGLRGQFFVRLEVSP